MSTFDQLQPLDVPQLSTPAGRALAALHDTLQGAIAECDGLPGTVTVDLLDQLFAAVGHPLIEPDRDETVPVPVLLPTLPPPLTVDEGPDFTARARAWLATSYDPTGDGDGDSDSIAERLQLDGDWLTYRSEDGHRMLADDAESTFTELVDGASAAGLFGDVAVSLLTWDGDYSGVRVLVGLRREPAPHSGPQWIGDFQELWYFTHRDNTGEVTGVELAVRVLLDVAKESAFILRRAGAL